MHLDRDHVHAFAQFIGVDVVPDKIGITRTQRRRVGSDLTFRQIKPHNFVVVEKNQRHVVAE